MGDGVALIDSAEATAGVVAELLERNNLISSSRCEADRVYVTDIPRRFETIAHRFLDGALPTVKRVDL
jgi:glutamate racemase